MIHGPETPHSSAKLSHRDCFIGQGLKQQQGIDKSNSDPFIKQHEGQLQVLPNRNNQWLQSLQHCPVKTPRSRVSRKKVLGALDLAPESAEIWFEAGKA